LRQPGNIVFKDIYGKNNQALLKFKTCRHCFCETKGTIFYGLDTPEEAVLRTSYDSWNMWYSWSCKSYLI